VTNSPLVSIAMISTIYADQNRAELWLTSSKRGRNGTLSILLIRCSRYPVKGIQLCYELTNNRRHNLSLRPYWDLIHHPLLRWWSRILQAEYHKSNCTGYSESIRKGIWWYQEGIITKNCCPLFWWVACACFLSLSILCTRAFTTHSYMILAFVRRWRSFY
jgi:hypothetical protein